MTYYSAKDVAAVYVGAVNPMSSINSLRLKINAVVTDTTALGDTWTEVSDTGIRNGELEMSGFYDSSYSGTMDVVSATDRIVSVLLEGGTVSKRFYGFQAATVQASEIGMTQDSHHTSATTFAVRGEVNHGYVVSNPATTRAAADNTDSAYADMGASGATGHAFMHLTNLTLDGYTSVTVTVRHSDDHVTFANHTAFTTATADTSEVKALASTVNRYLSIAWAYVGSGSSPTFVAFVGVAKD